MTLKTFLAAAVLAGAAIWTVVGLTGNAEGHTPKVQRSLQLIHKVDHARHAAQGCRYRLEHRRWQVNHLERHTTDQALRRWVLRLWTARASSQCEALRKWIEYANGIKARWIAAAEYLGRHSKGDPWPNCPDPHDGTGSWDDTKACEAPGYSWSACATSSIFIGPLQFHPMWQSLWRRFGIPC